MNRLFNGKLVVTKERKPRGFSSKAAKAAFKDILADKDMRITFDSFAIDSHFTKVPCILNEDILEFS